MKDKSISPEKIKEKLLSPQVGEYLFILAAIFLIIIVFSSIDLIGIKAGIGILIGLVVLPLLAAYFTDELVVLPSLAAYFIDEDEYDDTDVDNENEDDSSNLSLINDKSDNDTNESVRHNNDGIMNLLLEADKKTTTADEFREEGEISNAVSNYDNAIENYKKATEVTEDKESVDTIRSSLEDVREKHEEVTKIKKARDSLRSELQLGEKSFREAVAGYINGSSTVANIRFRQARDQYEEALATIGETDANLLQSSIEVSSEIAVNPSSKDLTNLSTFEDRTISVLKNSDAEVLTDIDSGNNLLQLPSIIDQSESSHGDELGDKIKTEIIIISWWYNEDTQVFESEDKISLRYEQATYGFEET